jgi:hypothetical protein
MATKSTAELAKEVEADLERLSGLVASPLPADPGQLAPASRLLWLKQVLRDLGQPTDFFAAADKLAQRATEMRTNAVMAQQQAHSRRALAANKLAADPEASLADAAAEWAAASVWLDTPPNMTRPVALQLAEDAARGVEGDIAVQIVSHAPRLWSLAQRKAREIVDEVATLPALPRQIWEVADPAAEFVRWKEHKATWGTLQAAFTDFNLCASVGNMVRDHLGYGYNRFPLGAPRTAMWLKNWRSELGDNVFARLKGR